MHKLILTMIFLCLNITEASAQLSPGPLHSVHADLEGIENCTQCHESGNQLAPEKCLECHTILAKRIENDSGLHANPEYQECHTCHIEHNGRDFELIHWEDSQDDFDHTLTGYQLEGAHAQLQCRECHTSANITELQTIEDAGKDTEHTFLGLNRECLSCHYDEHRGKLTSNCRSCHGMSAWKPVPGFSHDTTDYALTGLHTTVACSDCHPVQTGSPIQDDTEFLQFTGIRHESCNVCHQDIHQGKLGEDCVSCHTTEGWRIQLAEEFDHSRTDFPLDGAHQEVQCEECHLPGETITIENYQRCNDCHEDYHLGEFANRGERYQCEACHTVNGFSPSTFGIQRHQQSRYPLEGAHLAIPCTKCHQATEEGLTFRQESLRCPSCHSDPHDGQVEKFLVSTSPVTGMGGCEFCHTLDSWSAIEFDHQRTDFPLEGKHGEILCSDCHEKDNNGIIKIQGLWTSCQACHEDQHTGQFIVSTNPDHGKCDRCHSPSGWSQLSFDHNSMSDFSLDGRHAEIDCEACHKADAELSNKIRYVPLSSDCISCHGKPMDPNNEG